MSTLAKRLGAWLFALLLIVVTLPAAAYGLIVSRPVMVGLLAHFQQSALTGSNLTLAENAVADYMSGQADVFQAELNREGVTYRAFNEKEQRHMADVRQLVSLCRAFCLPALALWLMWLWGVMRRKAGPCFVPLCGWLIAVGLIAGLVCAGFDTAFLLFHQLAFTNDLWLMNPETDLIIQMMPEAFFAAYAGLIACVYAVMMVFGALLPALYFYRRGKKEHI